MLGVSAEGELGLRADDARNLGQLVRDDFGEFLVVTDTDEGDEVPVAGDGIHLGDAFNFDDGVGHFRDGIGFGVNHDECGEHQASWCVNRYRFLHLSRRADSGFSDIHGTMTSTAFKGSPVQLSGSLPAVGDTLPEFTVVGTDLADITPANFAGKRVVISVFPSVDTGVCAASVREFNQRAAGLDNTVVLNVSRDLPFALGRFCAAEGIENVQSASDFRHNFGGAFGLVQEDGPLAGLLARAVIVADENGKVLYTKVSEEIAEEPDYDAALAALN